MSHAQYLIGDVWWADHAGHPRPFMLQDWVDFLADIETGRATK